MQNSIRTLAGRAAVPACCVAFVLSATGALAQPASDESADRASSVPATGVESVDGTAQAEQTMSVDGTAREGAIESVDGTARPGAIESVDGTARARVTESVDGTAADAAAPVQSVDGTADCQRTGSVDGTAVASAAAVAAGDDGCSEIVEVPASDDRGTD